MSNRTGLGGSLIFALLIAITCACAPVPTPRPPDPTPTVTPIPPTAVVPKLEIFRYEPFALVLEHPKDWHPNLVEEIPGTTILFSYPVDNPSPQIWIAGEKANIQIRQIRLQSGETFEDWVKSRKESVSKDTQQRQVVVASVQGIEFANARTASRELAIPIQRFVFDVLFQVHPAAQADISALTDMFNQILSTMKFDEATLTILANATSTPVTVPPNWTPDLLRVTLPVPSPSISRTLTTPSVAVTPGSSFRVYQVQVSAKSGWVNSGINVSVSQTIQISASGQWSVGAFSDGTRVFTPTFGPDGQPALESRFNYPLRGPGVLAGTLVGKIGTDGTPFRVGSNLSKTTINSSGVLFFAMNDDPKSLDDNQGTVTVEITVYP